MNTVTYGNRTYQVDNDGFLIDFDQWDEEFAIGLAPHHGIMHGLTRGHWDVIFFVRENFKKLGRCPLVYQTCKMNNLKIRELKTLFPSGYLRGACKLAGLTYKEGFYGMGQVSTALERLASDLGESVVAITEAVDSEEEKAYRTNIRGFLLDPAEWDEQFAINKAYELKMPMELSEKHWRIIYFLRDRFKMAGIVPTVYETCESFDMEIEELERLFPDGYHRGAVKIAGLRVR
ncbi:MAG: TusE/DsrC/DsvC family sulfur relay protein [Candidatus Zixiibacteriota bacterium]